MKNEGSIKQVKSAIRTIALFDVFAELKRPMSLGELAARMNVPKSSCHELLQTLIQIGYIMVIDAGKSYYPSRRLFEMAEKINSFNPVKERVQSELKALRDLTGETVVIGRLQGNKVVYTEVFDGTHTIRYSARSGDLKAIHASALGKALLHSMDETVQRKLLAELKLTRFNANTITRKNELKENLDKCRLQGVYTTIGEHLADVMGIACPVLIQGYPLAIGIVGPIPRMQKNLENYSKALMDTVNRVMQ